MGVARPGLPNTAYATGIAGLAKDTMFDLKTRPAPLQPLLSIRPVEGGDFEIHLTGEPNRHYHLQASTHFQNWQEILVTNSATGDFTFVDLESSAVRSRFYRAQVGP